MGQIRQIIAVNPHRRAHARLGTEPGGEDGEGGEPVTEIAPAEQVIRPVFDAARAHDTEQKLHEDIKEYAQQYGVHG